MISVLLPSRGRPAMLSEAVHSLRDLASDPSNVEILVAADPDDLRTAEMANSLRTRCWVTPERFAYQRLWEYYNGLAAVSTGDWIHLQNDDALMTTESWDLRIEELPENILVADPQHNLSPTYVCFPAIRRKMYEILGCFSGPNQAVDSYIQDIARALGIVQPVDVWIDHKRPDITGGPLDSTYLEGRSQLGHEAYFGEEYQALIREAIEKLRLHL